MKEENPPSWFTVSLILAGIALVVIFVSVPTYCAVVAYVCSELGWAGGGAHDLYDGYCFERNEEKSEYRECDLSYVLAGECDPMWPDAE